MTEQADFPRARSKTLRRVLLGLTAAAAVVVLGGGTYWALTCPCDTLPGVVLLGEVHEAPVDDWSFANEVQLCQIQLNMGWRPHALNLNCMATPSGDLFLSCSAGAQKYWCPRVEADHPGRLRLDGVVYPVVLNRVTDPATLDAAWAARVQKLQNPVVQQVQPSGAVPSPDAERPESWWTFHVRSRASG
jgi:hypothetical protein